jgi:hypothetical protein
MSYYDIDDLGLSSRHKRLPDEIGFELLNKIEVKKRINNSEDPIDISIDKWDRICKAIKYLSNDNQPHFYYKSIYECIGCETCALCLTSINQYLSTHKELTYESDKCSICPLKGIEACVVKNSTFRRIENILESGYYEVESYNKGKTEEDITNDFNKLLSLSEIMLENLKKLK